VLLSRDAVDNFDMMCEYGLFEQLFPDTEAVLDDDGVLEFLEAALASTGDRISREQTVSPAFLYAALLWPPVEKRARELEQQQGHHPNIALNQAAEEVLAHETIRVAIPKRFSMPMREIWQMQPRFDQRKGGRKAQPISPEVETAP